MGLTTQYLQTSVHRHLPFLGPTMKVTDQDSGRLVDIEYDALRTVAANLNNDRPLKSLQAGHLSAPQGDHPSIEPSSSLPSRPGTTASVSRDNALSTDPALARHALGRSVSLPICRRDIQEAE